MVFTVKKILDFHYTMSILNNTSRPDQGKRGVREVGMNSRYTRKT